MGVVAHEPGAQPGPAGAPVGQLADEGAGVLLRVSARGDVSSFSGGNEPEQPVHRGTVETLQRGRDVRGLDDQVADEAFQIADQPILVGDECVLAALLEVDRALEAAHEGARVGREPVQQAGELAQQAVHDRGVGLAGVGVRKQAAQPETDVLERHRLELAAPAERRVVGIQRELGGLTLSRQLVQVAGTVEVLHGGDATGVRIGAEIAPPDQRRQGCLDRIALRGPERLGHVLGPEVDQEPVLGFDKGPHDTAVERGLRRVHVFEGLRLGVCRVHRQRRSTHDIDEARHGGSTTRPTDRTSAPMV